MMAPRPVAVLVAGQRTPFAKSFGDLMAVDAIGLGVVAVQGLLTSTGLDPEEIDEVFMGNVVVNSGSPNLAREVLLDAGLPRKIPGTTVVLQCLSGLECVAQGVRLIESGEAECVVAGGADSTSNAEVPLPRDLTLALGKYSLGGGSKKGWRGIYEMLMSAGSPAAWLPTQPGVTERSTGQTMGYHADLMAQINAVSRDEQDAWALGSHAKATAAAKSGILSAEITPVGDCSADDLIRPNMSAAKIAKLGPVFRKAAEDGTVTAASSSALTDGASAVLIMSEKKAAALGYPTDIVVRSYAKTAIDPQPQLLLAPAVAIPMALERAGLTLADIDIFEIHEAFSAQVLATIKCLESPEFAREFLHRTDGSCVGSVPLDRVNPNGSSIAIGHPFAATGGRIAASLMNELRRSGKKFGLISICAAGGIGGVMILENRGGGGVGTTPSNSRL